MSDSRELSPTSGGPKSAAPYVFHSLSICAGCGCSGDDFGSVNVEAFEMTGELYCEECAEGAIVRAQEHERSTWESPELEQFAASAQEGYQNPIAQVAFRAGFIFCREIMARFVEQGGDAATAQSIRANWLPKFDTDPGGPRKYDFAEVAHSEDMEQGPWVALNPGPSVDAAVYALTVMHSLGMVLPADSEASSWQAPGGQT